MKCRQKGSTTVEFAFVAALFFIVLFGVIEVGRALFVWNTLTEATRRGARVAAVCPVTDPEIARRVTVFGPGGGTSTASPILSGLTTDHVRVDYDYPGEGDPDFNYIRCFVRVSIDDYRITLLIPFFSQADREMTALPFQTTLPCESLGVAPPGVGPACAFP